MSILLLMISNTDIMFLTPIIKEKQKEEEERRKEKWTSFQIH